MSSTSDEPLMAAFTIDTIPGAAWPGGHFGVLQAAGAISHGVTTRDGPDFGDHADTERCAAAARAAATASGLADVAWVQQVHGGAVLRVDVGGLAGRADALVTDTPGLAVLGRSADCPLVLAAGRRADGSWAVGFAHASWRATVANLTQAMLARLCGELAVDSVTIRAAIAPCARVCCYEVGDEVREAALTALGPDAAAFFRRPRPAARWHFDLEAANLAQLAAAGVAATRIATSGVCTICGGERFWSWRRQGAAAGRFAALIGVRAAAL
jgi:polyphenol oxidase